MPVTIKCFASLREELGVSQKEVEFRPGLLVSDCWKAVTEKEKPENLLCARNLEYVGLEEPLADGDEVAFFPPVTGG